MIESLRASSAKRYLLFLLLFLLAMDLSILSDIPIFRQVLGFTFLTFVPGLFILIILRLNKLELTEKLVLSVGLSISFSMFAGLLINWVYPLFGYDTPLSTNPLLIFFSIIILILAVIAYLGNQEAPFAKLSDFKLNTKEKALLLLPSIFPLLGIFGMHLMNTTDNNAMLITLLILIPAYTIFIAIKHSQVPDRIYAPIILLSSVSLVLLLGLRSNHIIGADIHTEYYIFQQTFFNGRWQILSNSTLDSCLSISILPTIYQSFLNINSEYIFKILYPLLFSVSPLVIYLISRKYLGSFYAFLASLFFMSQGYFLGAAFSPRTVLAILFFALAICVLFHDGLGEFNKKVFFIIFTTSCIVSHYSTTYIFFIVLLLAWIGMQIVPRIVLCKGRLVDSSEKLVSESDPPTLSRGDGRLGGDVNASGAVSLSISQSRLKNEITIAIMVLFFVMLFLWYSQVTGAAFDSGVGFVSHTLRSLHEFFVLESRGGGVASALGAGLGTKGIHQKITFVFSWLTIVFIAIGVLTTLARYRRMVAFPIGKEEEASQFSSQRLDTEFFSLSLASSAVLVAAVALPFVFMGYGMDRAYCMMMVILSPFFVIGGITVAGSLRVRWRYLMVLVVLIPYFVCTTGIMYQVFGVHQVITLNSEGQSYDCMFIHEQETSAAIWVKKNANEETKIYSDFYGTARLVSQGLIHTTTSASYARRLIEEHKPLGDSYFYLRYTGVVDGMLLDWNGQWHGIEEYHDEFGKRNLIYTNNGSEIYR